MKRPSQFVFANNYILLLFWRSHFSRSKKDINLVQHAWTDKIIVISRFGFHNCYLQVKPSKNSWYKIHGERKESGGYHVQSGFSIFIFYFYSIFLAASLNFLVFPATLYLESSQRAFEWDKSLRNWPNWLRKYFWWGTQNIFSYVRVFIHSTFRIVRHCFVLFYVAIKFQIRCFRSWLRK